MRKVFVVLFLTVIVTLVIVSCGKKDKNRDDYDKIDHVLSNPSPTEAPQPTNSPTPTEYVLSTDEIMNSYSREDIHEATVDINVARVYDKPYQGKMIGYLVNEHFNTENLYRANHNSMYGFSISDTSGHFYEAFGEGVYEIKTGNISTLDIVWVYDGECTVSMVFHPEDYDFSDWGVEE